MAEVTVLAFLPEIITLVVAGGGLAIAYGMLRARLDDAQKEIDRLRNWKDAHETASTDVHSAIAGMDSKLDILLHQAGLQNGHSKD